MKARKEKLLKVEEVALLVGCSAKTVNSWYYFKRDNPENEYAKMLPEFELRPNEHNLQTRFWKQSDIWRLIQFKESIPKGRNGILGNITQVTWRKKKEAQNEVKEGRKRKVK